MSYAATLAASFGVSLFFFAVTERVLHAVLLLFMGKGGAESLRAQFLVGSLINLSASAGSGVLAVALRCAYAVSWLVVWYLLFYSVSMIWLVVYEDYPDVVLYFFKFYSKRIGPFFHGYLFLPLEFLDLLLKGVLPVYNGFAWILKTLVSKGFLPILWDHIAYCVDFAVYVFAFCKDSCLSVVGYLSDLDCSDLSCLERPPALDLVTPMSSVRGAALVAGKFLGTVCVPLSYPVELLLYPLTDERMAKGVHGLVNAVLQAVVHVPHATTRRCKAHGSTSSAHGVLMCTPDLQPAFDHAVSGLREVGGMVDNWLGVGAAMARRSQTGKPEVCAGKALSPDRFRSGLLAGAQTAVGLTDWLMASANGTLVYFFGQVTSDVLPREWPEPIDVRFGVAAVSFDEAGEVEVSGITQGQRPRTRQTTSVMGCRCLDTDKGVVVRCSVVPMSGLYSASTHSFDVQFQDATWSAEMECSAVEVSVRSVRWPVRRYEGKTVAFGGGYASLPELDCMSKGSCESLDATVWLLPRCDALRPEQCSDLAVGTSCYPFCMAARISGSRNANPVFVNAETWRGGKQLLMRDCALRQASAFSSPVLGAGKNSMSTAVYGQGTLSGAAQGAALYVSGSGDGSTCSTGSNMVSWVPANATKADPRSVPAYLRRKGQPFAIAGDTILMEFGTPDGSSTVEVDRLGGDQRDVYSLVPGWAGLPAAPKRIVPVQELTQEERGRVVVPLDFVATRVPSTSSRNFVFYAVSPDLRIFQAYLDYCRNKNLLPQVQIMMLSSYSALRVYRVRAYCQEQCEVGGLAAQFTFDGFSDGKFTAQNFPQDCSKVYNASIDGLEYVNEQNVAVTVQVADRTYDPLARAGSNSSYVTYWLNPQTMGVRRDSMWPAGAPSTLTAELCLPGDSVPHVGTLGAELGVAGLHLAHRVVGFFLHAPGLLALWRGGGACPLDSKGHSVLASCGQSVFSLDDFFDSLDASTAIFWGIPVWSAEQMEQGKQVEYSPVSDLLRGLGAYGRGTVGITEVRGGVMALLNTPLPEQLAGAYALVRQPGAMAGAAKVAGAASSWARFSARFFAVVGVGVARKLLVDGSLDMGDVWRTTVGTLYDERPFFKSTVTDRALSACLGLQTMVSGANPLGRLLHQSCLSSALLLDGGMDVFLHLFVDAPTVKCVCKDSEGKVVAKYARDHCLWKAPQTMQPILLGMISAASSGAPDADALLCPAVVAYTRKAMEGTMKPYFQSVYGSMDALGDLVDYTMSGFDTDSGRCSDFWQNPQVVVIMPEPVDYFQGCGATSSCRTKCAGTWDAFSEAVARYDENSLSSYKVVSQKVDSMFFPSVVADMIAPGKIMAMTSPLVCGAWVCRSDSDDCLAVAAAVGQALEVTYFCVPASPAATVYKSAVQDVNWATLDIEGNPKQVAFFAEDGSSIVALVDKQILLMPKGGQARVVVDVENIMSLPLAAMYPMQLIDFLAVRDRLLVNVAVRTVKSDGFERETATVLVRPLQVVDATARVEDKFPVIVTPSLRSLWKGYAVSEYPPGADAAVARLLLWPLTSSGSVRAATLQWVGESVRVVSVDAFELSQSLVARATLMPRQLILSKILAEEADVGQLVVYATSGAVYDWLRQLRLTGSGLALSSASLSNAQPVGATVTVRTACDGLDCRGCPTLGLRSLCSAYQSCAVFRCIGTPVNLKRPLCGVGGTLKSLGLVGVESVQGAWVMFVDIYMILLQLKLVSNLPGVDVSFPDDAFMGNLCAAKDVSAELISILTATVNSASQKANGVMGLFSHAGAVDSSVNTLMSVSTAAITGFLNQIALAPVYTLAVGHKIMMCQVSGTLAKIGATGFEVTIQSARFSSTDAISGQCLTKGAEVSAQQTGDPQSLKQTSSHAAEVLTQVGSGTVMKALEPFMHMFDGLMTYLIGIVAKMGEVLQAMDTQHCMLPDVTLKSAVRCACGDSPLSIRTERRREGLRDFAYWCTGTLSMPDAENRMQVVWNPFSYGELQDIVGDKLDAYLMAASASVSAPAPNHPTFAQQGVSMFAVLTRCRQNYVNNQWDSGAFVRYDAGLMEREVRGGLSYELGQASDGVGQCLLDSVAKGAGNGACMDSYLKRLGASEDYWAYSMADKGVPSQQLDACLVFSGPASNVGVMPDKRKVFQDCLGGYTDQAACDLSGFVWSPASSNAVPVASKHVVYSGNNSHLEDAYRQRMQRASDMVMQKLTELEGYTNTELEAAVFSAEGDVIHQLLDCVYLGPYARMDYWPVPRCDEDAQADCLVGPYWSRDAGKGKSRSLDIDTCEVTQELPFTCGSKTRQAMVRDFVKRYMETGAGGAELVERIIKDWLEAQRGAWWNPAKFGCDCEGCCDAGSYLPKNLSEISLQITTKELVNALQGRVRSFYRSSMISSESWISELAQTEAAKYNWTTSEGSHLVGSHGLYHPATPTMTYGKEEAMSPPTSFSSPSLWHTCHSALRQLMFTLPVSANGSLVGAEELPDFSGGGVEKITEHVKKLVSKAEQSSPLFRHYQARHHPSRSRMCNGSATKDARLFRGSVTFGDYSAGGNKVFDGSAVPPIPSLSFDAGVLGGQWQGSYAGLTDHLGFMDRAATESWLAGGVNLVTSADFLLRHGAGGLKAGNLPGVNQLGLGLPAGFTGDLDAVLREGVSEADRLHPLSGAPLHGCDDHRQSTESLLADFVDGLFPMAQGVRESGVGSYCLRFAVELAMLYAMEAIESTPLEHVVAQKDRVVSWRKKCGAQVQLVGMCNALDLYHDGGFTQYSCLYSWQYSKLAGVENYVTPDCLVKIGDYFYDPCQCKPEWCEPRSSPLSLSWADIQGSDCKLKFDPRAVVRAVELGWWAQDDSDPRAAAWNAWLEDPLNFLDFAAMSESLLADGQAVGNAPVSQHWATAEGFMNETGAFCDAVADYWPDDARFPVGYHVTLPCNATEVGYRTFDNVFVLGEDGAGNPLLYYAEDQSREADLVDSHFGAGGLCRGTNFGFDMYETNTMRVCTRVTDGEDVDVHVPAGKNAREGVGLPRCSESSRDLPWGDSSFYGYHDAAFYSVGTVPNLPAAGASVYPEDSSRLLVVGPQADMSLRGWGDGCQDLVLPNCSQPGWSCPAGFRCAGLGVCLHPSVECTRHSECPGEMMCSGLGTCETPKVSVDNQLGENVSFRAHTSDCAGEAFSMRGASYWGYVPDLLEAHGMCSYRHWQEYLYTLGQCFCSAVDENTCTLDAKACPYYVFSKSELNNRWWNGTDEAPARLKMIPTTCDRDYERFSIGSRELLSCVPVNSQVTMLKRDGTYEQVASRDKLWRLYDNAQKTVRLRRMPYLASKGTGFLSDMTVGNIKSCMSVQQCYVDTFTKNGAPRMIPGGVTRADRRLMSGALYDPNDQFRCGVIGYYDASIQKCVVDERVFPLYHVLCNPVQAAVLGKCLSSLKPGTIPAKCDSVQRVYSPQYSVINDVNVPALNAFFNVFKQPSTLDEHLSMVECATAIYSVISASPFDSKGLYYPFAFTLYEVPFSWFYQCNVGSSIAIPTTLDKKLYACTYYSNRNALSTYRPSADGAYTNFGSYIFNVRGGYVRSNFSAQLSSFLALALKAWDDSVEETRKSVFGSVAGVDMSYPRCYTELKWKLPSEDANVRKIIEGFVRNTCSSDLLSKYIKKYSGVDRSFNVRTIVGEITEVGGALIDQIGSLPSNKILSGFVSQFGRTRIQEAARLENIVTSVTPVVFNYSVPAVDSSAFVIARNAWKEKAGVLPNQADERRVENVQDCEDSQLLDVYRDTTGFLWAEQDTDLASGFRDPVKTCPVYSRGLFSCSYSAITLPSGSSLAIRGSSGGVEAEYAAYADALYANVKRLYDQKMAALAEAKQVRALAMQELPFFSDEAGLSFGDFSFDLQKVANYMNNINPDVKTSVMCTAGNQQVDYNTCNDANFNALKAHVYGSFSRDGSAVLPDRYQMDWSVTRRMMSSGAIFSFASLNRDISNRYIDRMFDSASVCSASSASRDERLCYFTTVGGLGVPSAITPWMSGWWNPYDKCDVDQMDAQNGNTERIDSYCYYDAYCPQSLGPSTTSVDYYKFMPNNVDCIQRYNEKTSKLNVNSKLLYNLCRHTLTEDSICRHAQGMVGGSDGFPSEKYAVGGNLYALHEFTKFPDGDGSLFGNALLKGARSDYGFLRFPVTHIGGHQLGLRIQTDAGMRVWKLPLKATTDKTRIASWDTADVADWVSNWLSGLSADHASYSLQHRDVYSVVAADSRGSPVLGWDCPLRRRAFYTGSVEGFKPLLPSARRSRRMFSDLTGDRHAHPTQFRKDGSVHFGRYGTTNGFCFCPTAEEVWPGMCSVATSLTVEHNCTLWKTVRAFSGREWGWSHTFKPRNVNNEYKVCGVQVDWPFVNGTLRDGSAIQHEDVDGTVWDGASDVESRRCHVLDRMPDFSYALVSRRQLRKSGFTTLDRGVCHTGRAQRRLDTAQRCVRVAKQASEVKLRCSSNQQVTMQRPASRSAADAVKSVKFYRRRCDRCARPPKFATRAGREIEPETSFGLHYRVSAERAVARDLKDAICANLTSCRSLFNEEKWVKGSFMQTLLRNPRDLFKAGVKISSRYNLTQQYTPSAGSAPDDSDLWKRPWVHCPTKEALRTGSGCNGTLTKQRWRSERVGACYSTMIDAMKGQRDPFAATDICNIDPRLTALCKAIREAQSLVASANCLKSGDSKCALQEYVYNPSTWETSNRAFVRQTVEEFYNRTDACADGEICVCPRDPELDVLRGRNAYFLKDCSAVSVMTFRDVLVKVRSLVYPICKMAGTFVDVAFNLVLTMSSSYHDLATSKLIVAWAQLKQESSVITDKVSDMFFDLIFSTGMLGPWLQEHMMSACRVINSAYSYTANTWCRLVIRQFPIFLSALRAIGGWTDVGFTVVNDVFGVILNNYLPNAMMDLYQYGYKEYFQSTKYREKQQAYEKRVEAGLVNPDQKEVLDDNAKKTEKRIDNKVMQSLAEGREKNMQRTKTNAALDVLTLGSGNVLGLISAGITVYQTYEAFETAMMIKDVMEKFPTTLTLFDFDNFYAAIDGLVLFLNGDFMCYDIDKDVEPLQCMALNFTKPSAADVMVMSPTATACWAEAQDRQVGVSNLYACAPTSTCCVDPLNCDRDSGSRLCADCPAVATDLVRYGCNTMIQRCQCGVQRRDVDRCLSQSECDARASCSLLTSLDDVSFGALQSCTECSTSPICLMGSNSQFGQCTCLANADAKVELCDVSVGSSVNPNPAKLCGYARDAGDVFSWSEISLVRCINAVRPRCAQVMAESGSVVMMPVCTKLRTSQVAYSSRRLLSVEESDARIQLPSVFMPEDPADDVTPEVVHRVVTESEWNHTSAPCSTLAHAYRAGVHLGPVDESALHSCVYWRTVARQLIKENGLVYLREFDTFLLSAGDLSAAIGQKGVLEELMLKPHVLFYALLYSQYLKPVRAALLASHSPNASRIVGSWKRRLTAIRNKVVPSALLNLTMRDEPILEDAMNETGMYKPTLFNLSDQQGSRGRRLMGVWEDTKTGSVTMPFYSVVNGPVANNTDNVKGGQYSDSEAWGSDLFTVKSRDSESECVVADVLVSNLKYVFKIVKLYYVHSANLTGRGRQGSVRKSLRSVLPSLRSANSTSPASSDVVGQSFILHYALQLAGTNMRDIADFLKEPCPKETCSASNRWTASYVVDSLMFCSFEDVMFCRDDRNDMFATLLFVGIFCVIASLVFNFLGLYGLTFFLFVSVPVLTLWHSTGVSPRCLPMIPTCALGDAIQSFKSVIPREIEVPSLLVVNSTKLVPCQTLGFDSWEDPLAFIWCDMGMCDDLNNTNVWGLSDWRFADMRSAVEGKHGDAYRFCSTVRISTSLPVVFIATFVIVFLSSFLISLIALAMPMMDLVWKAVTFNHSE